MALSVIAITPPAGLAGQSNGQLAASLLSSTPGVAGGPTVRLELQPARAWRALTAAASASGVTLQATGYADSYRTYSQQVVLFTSRYQVEPTGNGYKLWDSDGNGVRERWYKKDGVATAAVPGTSNHGWGLAVDVANASGARLAWLEAHALAYGWSWELVPEEPWHLHYFAGDAIPAAVLAYEQEDVDVDFNQDAHLRAIANASDTMVLDTDATTDGQGVLKPFPVGLTKLLKEMQTAIAALPGAIAAAVVAALPPSTGGGTGPVDLTDAAVDKVEDAAFRGAQRAEGE